MSWYLRSWAPEDVHQGVFDEGSVHATCGKKFFPQWISGQVTLHQLPRPEQVCPACLACSNGHVVLPVTCSRHPLTVGVVDLVVRRLDGDRIELASHAHGGCALTVDATLLLGPLTKWLR